jgi:hypothetical protein
MIGWVAATGHVTLMPVLLFLIIFMWTPPHFWALALFVQTDYAKVGIPMMPVVAGEKATRRQMLAYADPAAADAGALVHRRHGAGLWSVGAGAGAGVPGALGPRWPAHQRAGRMKPEKRLFAYSVSISSRCSRAGGRSHRHGARLASMNPNDDHLSPAESEAYRARQRARSKVLGLTLARWRCCSSRSRS